MQTNHDIGKTIAEIAIFENFFILHHRYIFLNEFALLIQRIRKFSIVTEIGVGLSKCTRLLYFTF